jgi:hypothetical protein
MFANSHPYDPATKYDPTLEEESLSETEDAKAEIFTEIQDVKDVVPTAEAQQSYTFPLCSMVKVGTGTICMIPHAYCYYKPTVSGSPTYCDDAPYPTQKFMLVKWGEDWSDLNGHCLVLAGDVTTYNGTKEIEAAYKTQIGICP